MINVGAAVGAVVTISTSASSLEKSSAFTDAFSKAVTPTLAAFDVRDAMKDPLVNDCVKR